MLAENAAEEAAAAAALGVKRVGTVDDLQCLDEDLENAGDRAARYIQDLLGAFKEGKTNVLRPQGDHLGLR